MSYYRDKGKSKQTVEYRSWAGMIQRCTNPNNPMYKYYGDNGITVCNRWRYSYANFLQDMGRKPSPEHSIDRKDNSLGYCPDNCIWSTRAEQSRNRKSVMLTKELAKEIRKSYANGMSQKDIITKYNITYDAAYKVIRNKTWQDI